METEKRQDFYTTVSDNILTTFDGTVARDGSIQRKSVRNVPNSGGSDLQSVFNFSVSDSNTRTRWDTTCIQFKVKFGLRATKAGEAVLSTPAWNAVADLIDSIRLGFNASGSDVYSVSNGNFLPCFTSRLLKYYTIDELNKKDYLFTPINIDGKVDEYMWQHVNATRYAPNAIPTISGAAYATIPNDAGEPIAAVATSGRPTESHNPAALKRYLKYISPNPFNAADTNALRTYTIRIPFVDMFPRMIGCMKNLRSVQIDINFKNKIELEKVGLADTSDGVMWYVPNSCKIITDDYVLSTGENASAVSSKLSGAVDNIMMIRPNIQQLIFNSGDLIISSKKNLESIMLIQFANQQVFGPTDVAANLGSSCGQFTLFNTEVAAAATEAERKSVCGGIPIAAVQINPPTTVQIQYGNILYPETPIPLVVDGQFEPSGIYYEMLKASGKVGDRMVGSPIPFELFGTTMPFIHLKPFSGNAIHTSDASDVIIKFGDSTVSQIKNKTFYAIVFEAVPIRINVDKTVQTAINS